MRDQRSASQILFGHLPDQTVDVGGGIWRVKNWIDPHAVGSVDTDMLRDELIRAASPWRENQMDGGFVSDLYARVGIEVRCVNRDRGIWCEQFPSIFVCGNRRCNRIHSKATGRCQCGATGRRGQLPFVGYHAACGALKAPSIPRCSEHKQRAVRLPGTASANELIFYCPVCERRLRAGFAGAQCDCAAGGPLQFNVHRASSVFTSRGVVLINPPKRAVLREIEEAGGSRRALDWVLGGMKTRDLREAPSRRSPEAVRSMLLSQGFDEATVRSMIAAMGEAAQEETTNSSVTLPADVRTAAERQAKSLAFALHESRLRIRDMSAASQDTHSRDLYERTYPTSLAAAGLERVELVDKFPVLTGQFGYTRGDPTPGQSRLRVYRERRGEYVVYGELAETEALFVRLDARMIFRWLDVMGLRLPDGGEPALDVLAAMGPEGALDPDTMTPVGRMVTTLVHSYAHAFVRRAAVYAGIERSSLSEVLLPHLFGFFVFAAAKGDFVLGGLQALFETELHRLFDGLVADEQRCALDPGCSDNGAACAVCLHLGEPSCRLFNTLLSRSVLAGGCGYFDVVADVLRSTEGRS